SGYGDLFRGLGVPYLLILLLEAVHAAFRVDQLLASGKERMAVRADFNADIALMRRARPELVPAGADDVNFFVSGMDAGFHRCSPKEGGESSFYHTAFRPPCIAGRLKVYSHEEVSMRSMFQLAIIPVT